MKTRILIADDHPIVRSGIRTELSRQEDFEITGEAVTSDQALEMTIETAPDVLILDISMPGIRAVEVIKEIHKRRIPTKILVYSAYGDKGTVSGILRVGVEGYMLKDEDPFVMPEAIRAIVLGQRWLSASITSFLVERAQTVHVQSDRPVLSEKEIEILRLISQGATTKEIASTLVMGERTVEFHLRNISSKLEVSSRAQAVSWAKDHKVL